MCPGSVSDTTGTTWLSPPSWLSLPAAHYYLSHHTCLLAQQTASQSVLQSAGRHMTCDQSVPLAFFTRGWHQSQNSLSIFTVIRFTRAPTTPAAKVTVIDDGTTPSVRRSKTNDGVNLTAKHVDNTQWRGAHQWPMQVQVDATEAAHNGINKRLQHLHKLCVCWSVHMNRAGRPLC
ncbi:hypothetical protein LSAT2_001769 [Lamellibrachia satsuma]|nr:hypothetical protein LSAT2_001769 [Lamellibrachia satsuma]